MHASSCHPWRANRMNEKVKGAIENWNMEALSYIALSVESGVLHKVSETLETSA